MRKIGYARVSTSSQNLDRQIAALRSAGVDEIYREKASGKDTKGRPQLEKAIDALGTGDVLVVAEWDRATRSMLDGIDWHVIPSAAVAASVRKTWLRALRRIRSGRVNSSGVDAVRASEVSGHRLDAEGLQSGPACVEVRLQRVAQARLPRCMDVLRDAVERLLLWIDGEVVGDLVCHADNVADVHGAIPLCSLG
jgi:hypothetical protein